jgi:hypothetical protein
MRNVAIAVLLLSALPGCRGEATFEGRNASQWREQLLETDVAAWRKAALALWTLGAAAAACGPMRPKASAAGL